jgi:mevalonate kinase
MAVRTQFPGKCILFGEHIVLLGESALVTPVSNFSGQWKIAKKQILHLRTLEKWIEWLGRQEELHYWLDVDAFARSVAEGFRFESQIPSGYGLGSSGALVAAVTHYFQTDKIKESEMPIGALQGMMARMESFFHGTSSGLDPLVSFYDQPILTQKDKQPAVVKPLEIPGLAIFLADTRQPRLSGQLISEVQDKNMEPLVNQALYESLLPASNQAIQGVLKGEAETVWNAVDTISRFQLAHWHFLFPGDSKRWTEGGLAGDKYRLKICGTGGGGFMLGFAPNMKAVQKALPGVKIITIKEA